MAKPLLDGVGSAARIGYRAVVPIAVRRRIRARLKPGAYRRGRSSAAAQLRRFELHLPRPAEDEKAPGRRLTSLVIEAPPRLYVAKMLHQGGLAGYEPETEALLLGLAEVLQPTVAFDVGANVGPAALILPAVLDVPVVAFEPTAEVAAVLRRLVALNKLRCTVEEAAVGERDGTATLFISPTDTSTSLQPGFRVATGERTVRLLSLDSYIRSSGLRPSLLKIDTETTEPAVLAGAVDLLKSRPWIVCEILPGWTEDKIEEILRPLGYRMFQIVDAVPFVERDTIAGNPNPQQDRNWLFAPEVPTPSIWDAVARWRRAIDACEPPRDLPPVPSGG
jgi:FkbM family methyltransferase